jgi:uncharacterized membrane protein YtjA (UPF0391 family)
MVSCTILSWGVVFLVVAQIAAVLGFTPLADTAAEIASRLFVVGFIVLVAFAGLDREGGSRLNGRD